MARSTSCVLLGALACALILSSVDANNHRPRPRSPVPSPSPSTPTDPFLIDLKPALTPWIEGTEARLGSSSFGVTAALVTLVSEMPCLEGHHAWPCSAQALTPPTQGPCVYRQYHYHIRAEETLVVVSGGPLLSVMMAPNNTVYSHNLTLAHEPIVYPRGWQHYQVRALRAGARRAGVEA
jgi:hypothetical protein